MNDNLVKLAGEAGFVLWEEDEYWNRGSVVDWSSEYDEQLQTFAKLIIDQCINIMHQQERIPAGFLYNKGANIHEHAIRDYFKL